MKIPGFLLLRPVQYAIGIAAVAGLVTVWISRHDAKVGREAVNDLKTALNDTLQAELEVVRDSAAKVVEATRDTLQEVRLRADVVRRSVGTASTNYDAQRRLVNTSAPQPAGVPAGHVVVPLAYVQAADSAIRMLPRLLEQAALERAASQQRIDALLLQHTLDTMAIRLRDQRIVLLNEALSAAKPSVSSKLKWAGYGAAAAVVALQLLSKN